MKSKGKTTKQQAHPVEVQQTNYRVYGTRWLQLVIYLFVSFTNGILPGTFSPIEPQTISFFGITSIQVNVLSIIGLFLYAPGTIFSIWAFHQFSMRTVIIVGSFMNLGAWIRLFSLISPTTGYPSLVIGQIFPGLAAPIFFNAATQFSMRWFPSGQRDLIVAICSMANPLGIAFGFLFPALIITDPPSFQQFLIVLITEAALVTLLTVIVLIGFQSGPPTPPSKSELHQKIELKEDLLALIKNKQFLILLFSFSGGFGLFNALLFILYEVIHPCGYTSADAGMFGAIIILAGLISAGIFGIIMDRTHAYIRILKILVLCSLASIIYFVFILRPSMLFPLAVAFGLMGIFLLPLLPVVLECAVECTYPISSIWSTSLLLCIGNVIGGIFTFILGALVAEAPTYSPDVILTPASIFILCVTIVSSAVFLFYNGPYLRLQADNDRTVLITQQT